MLPSRHIPNAALIVNDIPVFPDWRSFANTIDGYAIAGGFDRCAEVANRREPKTLTELRLCLFFESRREHFGVEPDAETERYISFLLDRIRERVAQADLE